MQSQSSAADRLAGPLAKAERAKKHIRELELELTAFLATNPYVVGTKRNPETRQLIYYVGSVEPVPTSIALIAGDVVQNLRSALDHLAYQLVLVGTGRPGPFRHVYFPIADTADAYRAQKGRKVKGMRQSAIDAIDRVKPYKGGNDQLWLLDQLNNIDKHRLLLTVGSEFHSMDYGRYLSQEMRRSAGPGVEFLADFPDLPLWIGPADRLCPLKPGDELFIDRPDAEVDQELQFTFDVAFSEPKVVESEHVRDTLVQIADVVEGLLESFRPLR